MTVTTAAGRSATRPSVGLLQFLTRDRAIALCLCIASIAWSLLVGKDINWDQLNYHFYVAHAFLNDRLHQDFLPANEQSYLNPLAYIPFYWMVMQGWHSAFIASLLASFHSLNIILAYRIALVALPQETKNTRTIALSAAFIAFLSPIYLLEAGTSFADITTSVLVLFALLLAISRRTVVPWWRNAALLGGVCIGVATGLKLTNAIYGIAYVLTLVLSSGSWRDRVRDVALVGAGAGLALIITHGYWSWRLYQEFGNPLFPLVNTVFRSPDYPLISHHHQRFLADSFLEAVSLPFRMVQLRSWVYVEHMAPDLRFSAVAIAAITVCVQKLRRIMKPVTGSNVLASQASALVTFFLISYILWVWTSGNGRYGIVLSILCGPLLAVLTYTIVRQPRSTLAALIVAAVLQILHFQHGEPRWTALPWTKTWFEASIPKKLSKQPYLYVSVDDNSNSYLVPFLAPGSAFVNPYGQLSLDLDGPGGQRLSRLLNEFEGRTRVISITRKDTGPTSLLDWQEKVNSLISRLGLTIDTDDCLRMRTAGASFESGVDFKREDAVERRLMSCAVKPQPFTEAAERAKTARTFQHIVEWCPKLFGPAYVVVERAPQGWFSNFTDTDTVLRSEGDQLILVPKHASGDLHIGHAVDWEDGKAPLDCRSIPTKPRRLFDLN